ncbi:hypothetical protein FA13DRAFT_1414130 [Coprinellus micaceus]|uniref:Uncharacterized protein n=1 Tax=Coprinellus micaceus TaxID=71717 RepID=A0A4Y7SNL1_COPMI|nr:hypothetical protein FA13DRAFT_1414130 [Coprinellus micaceus]
MRVLLLGATPRSCIDSSPCPTLNALSHKTHVSREPSWSLAACHPSPLAYSILCRALVSQNDLPRSPPFAFKLTTILHPHPLDFPRPLASKKFSVHHCASSRGATAAKGDRGLDQFPSHTMSLFSEPNCATPESKNECLHEEIAYPWLRREEESGSKSCVRASRRAAGDCARYLVYALDDDDETRTTCRHSRIIAPMNRGTRETVPTIPRILKAISIPTSPLERRGRRGRTL